MKTTVLKTLWEWIYLILIKFDITIFSVITGHTRFS